ncbi:SDR family oxidoreductase [uncultured Albimonas sp.]|uniref:SDR family oxidoreductase n=1 Tax=uncultured Albimonas sp. TaxID=1331701 RepID=UPI0030EDC1D5
MTDDRAYPEDPAADPQEARETAARHRDVQQETGAREAADLGRPSLRRAPQTGARDYPVAPQPAQHQEKPGREAALDPQPMCDAPYWRGSGKLEGMSTLVTGGDSGIGRAVAVLFAREGADVAVAYLDEHEDAEETGRLVEAEGRRCLLIPGDVGDAEHCEAAVSRTARSFGGLDVLVNNAAFQLHASEFEALPPEQVEETLRTNLMGLFHMSQAAARRLPEGGAIVNSGSVAGLRGSGGAVDYATSKGGIHAFTQSLAQTLLPKGIRVNAVAPGPVWTPLNPADRGPEGVKHFGENTPMGRPAQPEELAPAYLFLASPQMSSYVTGTILPVTGGG